MSMPAFFSSEMDVSNEGAWFKLRRGIGFTSRSSSFSVPAMPTEVPYAADAEISLTYDELEVF